MAKKTVYLIAGPKGSGKTTFAREFLAGLPLPFLNADEIALALSPQDAAAVRVSAGKRFLAELDRQMESGESFAFESTLAGGVPGARSRIPSKA